MTRQLLRIVAIVGLVGSTAIGAGPMAPAPGECARDAKLIGLIEISAVDAPDTWWGITKAGLADAGIDTTAEVLATLNGFFGTSYVTLPPLIELLLEPVRDYDVNGNDFICAFSLRGKRSYLGDPEYTHYTFGTSDDKVR